MSTQARWKLSFAVIVLLGIQYSCGGGASSSSSGGIYYVDPTYTAGSNDGSEAHPYTSFSSGLWAKINSDLKEQNVTVYVSALQDDGITQETLDELVIYRTNSRTNRLTIDGGSKYNTSPEGKPGIWANNPTPIQIAYTTNMVCKLTGSDYIGWSYNLPSQSVSRGGLTYYCISTHISDSSNEPGVGPKWAEYWDQHGTGGSDWVSGTEYYTYEKQDYVTIRGFEPVQRLKISGDYFIGEYLYVHDTPDAGIATGYVCGDGTYSYRTSRGSNGMTFRHIHVDNTGGECMYLGSGSPDSANFANTIEHRGIAIQDFHLSRCGATGGQGDGIDIKIGTVGILIEQGEIDMSGAGGLPQGAISVRGVGAGVTDLNYLISKVYIHGVTAGDNVGISLFDTAYQGFNQYVRGVTIENSIFANNGSAIGGSVSAGSNIGIYNNTFYNTGSGTIGSGSGNFLRNNVYIGDGSTGSTTASNNAYSGSWSGACSNCISGVVTTPGVDMVDAPNGDYSIAGTGSKLCYAGYPLMGMVTTDYTGVSRPQGSAWSIGAYEFVSH